MLYDAIQTKNSIVHLIKNFESKLDSDTEMALIINGVTFVPYEIAGTEDTNLIIFAGKNIQDSPVTFIQHVTQVNFSMLAIKKTSANSPRRIGFTL